MADAADSIPAPRGQFLLTVEDLNTAVNHEPRIKDIRLAEALGLKPAREIRRLIERHREALERLGQVCVSVPQTSAKGGRPGRTFWLNKRQCLYLCTKSETPNATEVTIAMVEVFDAHLAGLAAVPVKAHRRSRPRLRAADRPAAPVEPASTPRLDQDGYALVRLAGETLLVDLQRIAPGQAGRAVAIGWDARIVVEDMVAAKSNAPYLGQRSVLLPDATNTKSGHRAVFVVGAVVATVLGAAPEPRPREAARPAPRKRAPLAAPILSPMPSLAVAPVAGHA